MPSDRLEAVADWLDERAVRFRLFTSGAIASWRQVLAVGREAPSSMDPLWQALADLPFRAFRWEAPALTSNGLDTGFECVAVDDPSIDVSPDPAPFAEHFRRDRPVARFANLGGDAVLVVPCPRDDADAYAHLARFLRRAPSEQRHALWMEVARAMVERLDDRPVWLSTAGGGVAWLHVRLDDRPKYYLHAPYRQPVRGDR
jgi:hypothetical protein